MQPLPLEDVPRLAKHLHALWNRDTLPPTQRRDALLVAAMLLGLRSVEVVRLRPNNISVKSNTLRMQRAKHGRTVTIRTPATWCSAAMAVRRDFHLRHHNTRWLFTTRTGTQINRSHLRRCCAMITANLLGQPASPHDLRHTAAIICWQQTHDPAAVMHLLGHTSLRTTATYLRSIVPVNADDPFTWSLATNHLRLFDPDLKKGATA